MIRILAAVLLVILAAPSWAQVRDEPWVKELRKAADQDGATAQFNLGIMYVAGQEVPQDYVQAHMWFNLAAATGNIWAAMWRFMAEMVMTPADISKAQRLARQWHTKHGKK